jgi:hypothetical protein
MLDFDREAINSHRDLSKPHCFQTQLHRGSPYFHRETQSFDRGVIHFHRDPQKKSTVSPSISTAVP